MPPLRLVLLQLLYLVIHVSSSYTSSSSSLLFIHPSRPTKLKTKCKNHHYYEYSFNLHKNNPHNNLDKKEQQRQRQIKLNLTFSNIKEEFEKNIISSSCQNNGRKRRRRTIIQHLLVATTTLLSSNIPSSHATTTVTTSNNNNNNHNNNNSINHKDIGELFVIHDPNTYSALAYVPKSILTSKTTLTKKYPVIIVLHGAGQNKNDIWNLANINGEHAGLIPSLLFNTINTNQSDNSDNNINNVSNTNKPTKKNENNNNMIHIQNAYAPKELYENFIVIAPYSYNKTSFYNESRSKILQFVKWAISTSTSVTSSLCGDADDDNDSTKNSIQEEQSSSCQKEINFADIVDLDRLFLFGFSDGATLGIELMTTNLFKGGIFAAYGFTGTLPQLALERLKDKPMWIFHSVDDVIFPVACSDALVKSLRTVNHEEQKDKEEENRMIRYSRFDHDQEGFTGNVRGHSTGITASKDKEVYKWLLQLDGKATAIKKL